MRILKEAFTELQLRIDLYRSATPEDRNRARSEAWYSPLDRNDFLARAQNAAKTGDVSTTAANLLQVGRHPERITIFSRALSLNSIPTNDHEDPNKMKRANRWAKFVFPDPVR